MPSPGSWMRYSRGRLRSVHLVILTVLCISCTWILSTLWLPDARNSDDAESKLRANILRLSADYVRLLAREQQDTADGPYRSLGTNYDMKKTMAVLLNEMNIRVEQLDAQVKELSARVTGSGTESRSLSPSQSQRRLHQIGGVTEGIVDFVSLLRGVQEGCVVDAQKLLSFPECESKIKWLRARWRSDPCYAELGVDGTDCSLVRYLSEVENFCPFTEDKLKYSSRPFAQITYDLTGLLTGLSPEEKHDLSYRFIRSRLTRMWPQWVDGMRRYASWNGVNDNDTIESQQRHTAPTEPDFSYQPGAEPPGQPHFFNRTRLNIHLHLSFISLSSSALFEQSVGKGGPLGELVQWTDLLAGLYILGHNVSISIEPLKLFEHFNFTPSKKPECQTEQNVFDLLFTDIVGYRRLKRLGIRIPKCKYRILDSFGTEALFNRNDKNSTWGGLQLNLKQFYTMFPHSPDNTFLGFVVESPMNTVTPDVRITTDETVRSKSGKPIALIYGKEAYMWKDALPYLTVLNESLELHANVMDAALGQQFSFVVPHKCNYGTEFITLMRSAKTLRYSRTMDAYESSWFQTLWKSYVPYLLPFDRS